MPRIPHLRRDPALALLPLLLLLPQQPDATPAAAGTPGAAAYREGRFGEALQEIGAAEQALGDDAPAELLVNRALAALAAGRANEAEWSIEKAVARGGPAHAPLRDFLRGNAAWARCTIAELQASGPEAEPFAFQVAIGHAEAALGHWQEAARTRHDWPAAARNVERALRKIRELRVQKTAAERRKAQRPKPEGAEPQPQQPPPPDPDRPPSTEAAELTAQNMALPPELVLRLLQRLDAKEREKNELRRAEQERPGTRAERDW